ncbi:MAG: peptide deformylase [Desulfovibrio sp.]|nr:peptide deformylase [Desulfovibrio sp.]
MLLPIITYPDPSLKKIAIPITEFDDSIRDLAESMLETMYVSNGVGLAAPQVGRSTRLIVIDPDHYNSEKNPRVFINPEIELIGENIVSENEGCLSVPLNYRADIPRNNKIKVKYQNILGEIKEEIFEGFPAIIIQHEVDHLDGKLFIDKISRLKRSLYESKVKKWIKNGGLE